MRTVRLILSDFIGLLRVCGLIVALRWISNVMLRLPECKRLGNLSPADRAFGDGPVRVHRNGRSAQILGPCVMTGIREVWVRDSYLKDDFISLGDNSLFVDLGAGAGSFTILAMIFGENVRAVAVEAEADRCRLMKEALELNHLSKQAKVINAFVGGGTTYGEQIMAAASNRDVPTISAGELLTEIGSDRIDLLKCDIEGSEFELFRPGSQLLAAARQLAMEIHPVSGNSDELIANVKAAGFDTLVRQQGPTLLLFGRKRAAAASL